MTEVSIIQDRVKKELANPETLKTLLGTTFKGLSSQVMQQAIVEGMIRGFDFKDFLEKNIYAIPFSGGYSLITSVDFARKVGMRSGVVGVSTPSYEMDGDKIVSCTVTVKRKVDEYVGEYSATVYFSEYNTGRNLWVSKPRTMIAKVAEMHALRKACPEQLSQSYLQEEMEESKSFLPPAGSSPTVSIDEYQKKLEATQDYTEMSRVWSAIPIEAKKQLIGVASELKKKYADKKV